MPHKQMGRNKRDRHMIYQIANLDVQAATEQGAMIICWSTDGKYVLISANSLDTSITVIEHFEESHLESLLKLHLWQQPCISC